MRNLQTTINALLAAAIVAWPSQLLAQEWLYTDFRSETAPGKLISDGLFQGGVNDIEIIGALIIVKGPVSSGDITAKVIEYTKKGTRRIKPLPGGLGRAADFELVGLDHCESNEPVLQTGPQGNYHIQWCKKAASNPKWAKQNWYYEFLNGDFMHVATFKYNCNDADDVLLMGSAVYNGACL